MPQRTIHPTTPPEPPAAARPVRRDAPSFAPARFAWAALALLLLLAAFGAGRAAEPVWLEPFAGGVAALYDDGRVVRDAAGERPREIAAGWGGDRLVACGGRLYGIDRGGRLAEAARRGAQGPPASLHADPACLPPDPASGEPGALLALADDGTRLLRLDLDLAVRAERITAALPDTELVAFGPYVALLADPTLRYRHGVLGDEIEAGSVLVLRGRDLAPVARWRVGNDAVIEQRGVVPVVLDDNDGDERGDERWGVLATRSSARSGAQVVLLELRGDAAAWELVEVAAGPPIGRPNRWLNLFAARDGRAWSVQTPHLGGPLVRWGLPEGGFARRRLTPEPFQVGVTNHVLGSRNLDLGALLPEDPTRPGVDLLVLPRQDLRALRVVRCALRCQVTAELPLAGRLTSNLVATRSADGAHLFAGDDSGAVQRFALDARGERRR